MLIDSEVESNFARDCSLNPAVKLFFKLPRAFKIETPLGNYNPDWAVVLEVAGDEKVYFVIETKSSLIESDRRHDENLKIRCGEKHFKTIGDVTQPPKPLFKTVSQLTDLTNLLR